MWEEAESAPTFQAQFTGFYHQASPFFAVTPESGTNTPGRNKCQI